MRTNPKLDASQVITELGVGEALVSFLDAKGTPGITERAWVLAPGSQIGPITPDDRRKLIADSAVAGTYEKAVDRESAYEQLKSRAGGGEALPQEKAGSAQAPADTSSGGGFMGGLSDILFGSTGPRGGRHEGMVEAAAKSAARSVGSSLAREITRGMLGGLLGGSKRGR
jgi:hypothetical protein